MFNAFVRAVALALLCCFFAFAPALAADHRRMPVAVPNSQCGRIAGRDGLRVTCVAPQLFVMEPHRASIARGPFGIYGATRVVARRHARAQRIARIGQP